MPICNRLQLLFVAALTLTISSHVDTRAAPGISGAAFLARCQDPSVVTCLALDSEAEIARLRFSPRHLDASTQVQWDPRANAARFTIPSRSPADSSGQLHIPFSQPLANVYFSFDVRYPGDMLRYQFKGGGGWKIFILGQGREGCAPFEIVANNPYYRSYPSFYYKCGATSESVAVQNPLGDNVSQFDYQPGGDTACLRSSQANSKPCAYFEPDLWVTYQVHVNAAAAVLEAWQTVRGKTQKIIDFPLQNFPIPPPKYEWLKLTPYNTGKDASEEHPAFFLWYRRVIVSTRKIPFPAAE